MSLDTQFNLNRAHIKDDMHSDGVPLRRRDEDLYVSDDKRIVVFFDGIEDRLVEVIRKYPKVVGCMAWLTNEKILTALRSPSQVSIIVNKEDFLRPDRGNWSQQKVKDLYNAIPSSDRHELFAEYSYCGDPTLQAVRCAGISAQRSEIPPRMHHKFLVFCENGSCDVSFDTKPVAVWTGSFNATWNATQSLENAVLIYDESIALAYYREWISILGLSEPLNWKSRYVSPEWRLGS